MNFTRIEGIAEGDGDDLFGGGQPWPNGPDPGAEKLPGQRGFRRGEDLKQSLGDETELDVAMVGGRRRRRYPICGAGTGCRSRAVVASWPPSRSDTHTRQ